jgi:O-antigen ligase
MATLWGRGRAVAELIWREKWLTLFLVWVTLSLAWSDYPLVTIKRALTVVGEAIVCIAFLFHTRWSSDALRPLRIIVGLYAVATIVAVAAYPEGAIQWDFPALRGLARTKNNLGQIALFSIVVWFAVITYHNGRWSNLAHLGLLGLSLIAYFSAQSMTSFLAGGVLLAIWAVRRAGTAIATPFVATTYTIIATFFVLILAGVVLIFTPEFLRSVFGWFGKDLTFTGRVDLWGTVYTMTADRWWLGWGFGGFWVMDSPHLVPLFQVFPWIPNQAHQGYLDVFNQTGIVGLFLLVAMIVHYFAGIARVRTRQLWIWLVFAILVFNLQESLFFRPRHIGHFLFLFSYLALWSDALRERRGLSKAAHRSLPA